MKKPNFGQIEEAIEVDTEELAEAAAKKEKSLRLSKEAADILHANATRILTGQTSKQVNEVMLDN